VSIAFALIPTALESHDLSPYLLGGIGLVAGTLVGPGGMGGVVLDMFQKKREVAILAGQEEGYAAPIVDLTEDDSLAPISGEPETAR
jgi:hypothetical protein